MDKKETEFRRRKNSKKKTGNLATNEDHDTFYELKKKSIKHIKEILQWANDNGLKTQVTMLDARKSFGRIKSDKDFKEVLSLANKEAINYFVIILRKQVNLWGILTDERVLKDLLEIGIRGINANSKEYFIMIYLDKKYLGVLNEKYALRYVG